MTPAPESLEVLVSRLRRLLDAARLEVLGAASGMVGPMPATGALNAETMRVLPLLLDSTERMLKYEKLVREADVGGCSDCCSTEALEAQERWKARRDALLAASPSPPQKG